MAYTDRLAAWDTPRVASDSDSTRFLGTSTLEQRLQEGMDLLLVDG